MFMNIFLLALLAPVIAIILTKLYDKFEKKDYPTKTYIQVGTLSYISGVLVLYAAKTFMCSSGVSCPWLECKSSVPTPTPTLSVQSSSTVTTSDKTTSAGLFEKVLKTVSQSGGSPSNLTANPTGEVFHTGTPTF